MGCVILFALLVPAAASAQLYPEKPAGFVNDYARLLSSSQSQQLERKLSTYRDTTSNVIVVATLASLNDISIEEVGTSMFSDWKMWEGDRQNGVLILIVPSERKIRIEVGYGLEGAIPDILAGRVITQIIQPAFRAEQYYQGIDRATSALMQLAAGEYEAVPRSAKRPGGGSGNMVLLLIIIIILFVIIDGRKRGGDHNDDNFPNIGPRPPRRRSHITYGPGIGWGGNYGGGGFGGGFGGGGFGGFGGSGGFGSGGGGASGGW